MKDFKIGQPVLFCNGWGEAFGQSEIYRWGNLRAGFITDIEHIEAHNCNLYTVSTVDAYDKTQVRHRLLGEHLVFGLNERNAAFNMLKEVCCEVEEYEWA